MERYFTKPVSLNESEVINSIKQWAFPIISVHINLTSLQKKNMRN